MADESQEALANVATPEVKPEAAPEQAAPPAEETAKPADETQPEVKTEKTFTQKELDEILQKRLAKEQRKFERLGRAEAERDLLRQQIEQMQKPQQETQANAKPDVSQFKTYEDYIDALTDWKTDQALTKREQATREQQQRQSQQTHEERLRQNLTKAADKFEDFEEVVGSIPAQYVTAAMRDAIGESDMASEIAYHLGINHKEAAEIARLSPVQQVKAIDRLEAKLKAPKPVSQAPAPANTVGKGKAQSEIDPQKASLDEYMAMRRKQGARWAR